ncbi:MAG: SRPBCC family protein, partial [Gammaproteobacteria bacterium]
PPERVWQALIDENVLGQIIPGCHGLVRTGENAYAADVTMGIGAVKGRFEATVKLEDLEPPHALAMAGSATGPLGDCEFRGRVTLRPDRTGTVLEYRYTMRISGKVAAVGARMLEGASRALIGQFFRRLVRKAQEQHTPSSGWLARLVQWLGLRR